MKFKLHQKITTIKIVTQEERDNLFKQYINELCEQGNSSDPKKLCEIQLKMESYFIRMPDVKVMISRKSLLHHLLLHGNDVQMKAMVENCLKNPDLVEENYKAMKEEETRENVVKLMLSAEEVAWKHLMVTWFTIILTHRSLSNDNQQPIELDQCITTVRVMVPENKKRAVLKAINKICEQDNTYSPDVVYLLQLKKDSIFVREGDEVEAKDYPLLYYLLRFMFIKGDAMFESIFKLVENYLKNTLLVKESHNAMMAEKTWIDLGYLLFTLKMESWKRLIDVILSHPSAKQGLAYKNNGFNLFRYCMEFLSENLPTSDESIKKNMKTFCIGVKYLTVQKRISLCQQDESGTSVLCWLLHCNHFKKDKGPLITWLIRNGAEHRKGFTKSMAFICDNFDFGQEFLQKVLKHYMGEREEMINTLTGMSLQSINSGALRNHNVSPVVNKLKRYALQCLD